VYQYIYTVSQKNVPLCHFAHLRQILTDFQNFFTGTYCGQLVIKWLLNIPPHLNCVATLPCETQIFKNHYNHCNIYAKKASSETIFINCHTKIKLCLVLQTFLMFMNKTDDIVINNNF